MKLMENELDFMWKNKKKLSSFDLNEWVAWIWRWTFINAFWNLKLNYIDAF